MGKYEMHLHKQLDYLLEQTPVPVKQIVELIVSASLTALPEHVDAIKNIANMNEAYSQVLAYPALALLPAWGSVGIDILSELAMDGRHDDAAIGVLATTALGRVCSSKDVMFLGQTWDYTQKYKLSDDTVKYSIVKLRSLILEHSTSPYLKGKLFTAFAYQVMYRSPNDAYSDQFDLLTNLLVDSHLTISKSILEGFEDLLDSNPLQEEKLHKFLLTHPVLLDPFVTELYTKHELGSDFITDFVIRRINNEYILVEIENSTDRLFNQNGAFSSNLVDAISQMRDFQAWVSDNIAYAQTKLAGIRHPEGLVVIGRSIHLTATMQRRLVEENYSRRGHIKIVTFDDLLNQARSVYKNLLEKPVVLRSREQRRL